MAIVPRPVEGAFGDALFDFIVGHDGLVPRVFSDDQGIPTLGIGYAMLVNTPGWPPSEWLDRDLAAIGIRLTAKDRQRLIAVGEALSRGDIRTAKALVKPRMPGDERSVQNSFSFTINRAQAQALFERTLPDFETVLQYKLGRGIVEYLAESRELVALSSLAYHNPALIGPHVAAALQEGAREKVWYAIRFGSNHTRHPRLQQRRNLEAQMFGLTNEAPSRSELAAVAVLVRDRELPIRRYLADFGYGQAEIEGALARLSRAQPCKAVRHQAVEAGLEMKEASRVPPRLKSLNGDSNPRSQTERTVPLDC